MANICLYKIKVKGTRNACYALVNMMPLYSWEKEYISEEGTDADFTLIFSGACKWSVDAYTRHKEGLTPYTPEEISNVNDGDGWDIPLEDKSLLLGCEVFCNSKDIDDYCYAEYVHYDKGKQFFDECPKELHIKRGRDYDLDYEEPTQSPVETPELPACKVRFDDNRSYWYIGDFQIGDLVYVEGKKANRLGQVKDKSTTHKVTAIYKVLNSIGNIELFTLEDVEKIWDSYKSKERKEYLASWGWDIKTTKKQYLTIMENEWIKQAQKGLKWTSFIKYFSMIADPKSDIF